jgi:protein-tyrosine phosphatase
VAKSLEELDAPDPTRHIETLVAATLGEARSAVRETIDEALDEAAEVKRQTAATVEDLEWIAKADASRARSEGFRRAEEIVGIRDADAEAEASLPADGNEALERRLSDLHAAVEKMRRLRGELRKLHSISSSLRKILDSGWAQSDAPIRVIMVCTWNRFRSPIAAEILKREAAELGCEDLVVSSRGTKAPLGYAAPSEVVNCAGRLGIDITGHRSKRLTRADLILADLVVVMEKSHADVVRGLYPWANIVLLGHLRDAIVNYANLGRGTTFAMLAQDRNTLRTHEIMEPIGRSNRGSYEQCVQKMTPHLHFLAEIIAAFPQEMSGYGRRHFAFEELTRGKGAEYAANS